MAAGVQGNTVLLACRDPDDPFIGMLKGHFERQAFRVKEVTSPEAAKIAAGGGQVVFVVVDSSCIRADELIGTIKLRQGSRPISVLRIIGSRAAAEPTKFGFLADETMRAPCEVSEILLTARAVLAKAARAMAAGRTEVSFIFAPEPHHAERASETVARLLGDSRLPEEAQVQLVTASREAIGASLRPSARGAVPGPLTVTLTADAAEVLLTIAATGLQIWPRGQVAGDAALARAGEGGAGGSIASASEARESALSYSMGLIARCVDRVVFADKGDSITLVKRRAE